MLETNRQRLKQRYEHDGYISGIEIITPEEAACHRRAMENAETALGPLHYKPKIHTISTLTLRTGDHAEDARCC